LALGMRESPRLPVGRGVEQLGRDLAQRLGQAEAHAAVARFEPVHERDVEQPRQGRPWRPSSGVRSTLRATS
jgi:hypothetical protein